MTAPGWYPDPTGAPVRRYWDGVRWTGHAVVANRQQPMSPAVWVIIGLVVAICLAFAGWAVYDQTQLVRDASSSNPNIEAFYRDLESQGFGDMKKSDALEYAKDVCDHGNALAVWFDTDRSMADSFKFSTVALKVCHDL